MRGSLRGCIGHVFAEEEGCSSEGEDGGGFHHAAEDGPEDSGLFAT